MKEYKSISITQGLQIMATNFIITHWPLPCSPIPSM